MARMRPELMQIDDNAVMGTVLDSVITAILNSDVVMSTRANQSPSLEQVQDIASQLLETITPIIAPNQVIKQNYLDQLGEVIALQVVNNPKVIKAPEGQAVPKSVITEITETVNSDARFRALSGSTDVATPSIYAQGGRIDSAGNYNAFDPAMVGMTSAGALGKRLTEANGGSSYYTAKVGNTGKTSAQLDAEDAAAKAAAISKAAEDAMAAAKAAAQEAADAKAQLAAAKIAAAQAAADAKAAEEAMANAKTEAERAAAQAAIDKAEADESAAADARQAAIEEADIATAAAKYAEAQANASGDAKTAEDLKTKQEAEAKVIADAQAAADKSVAEYLAASSTAVTTSPRVTPPENDTALAIDGGDGGYNVGNVTPTTVLVPPTGRAPDPTKNNTALAVDGDGMYYVGEETDATTAAQQAAAAAAQQAAATTLTTANTAAAAAATTLTTANTAANTAAVGFTQADIDKAVAAALATQQAASSTYNQRQGVYASLADRFAKYGLTSLANKIKELAMTGATEATITLQLMETPEYQQRFAANADRLKKGLSVLTPAEYVNIEDGYRQVLRAYGLKQFDNDAYVKQFIANDMSPTELSNRVVTAVQRVQNADPALINQLKQYYGIGATDMVAYVLDPEQQFQKIERQIAASEIGVAAGRQGLKAGVSVAEQLAAQGVTEAEARKGYSTIADILPTAEKLSDIYGTTLDDYRQAEGEQEVFNGLASAQRKRQALTAREIAAFSGASGVNKTSLTTSNVGQY